MRSAVTAVICRVRSAVTAVICRVRSAVTAVICRVRSAVIRVGSAVAVVLPMQTLDGTHIVPASAKSHRVLLSGVFLGGSQVLVRADIVLDASGSVNMQLAIRSERDDVSQAIAASVA